MYDKFLYLRDSSVSGAFSTPAGITVNSSTPPVLLAGTPLRGLECNIVVPLAQSTPSLTVALMEGASTGATHYTFRQYPVAITAAGVYKMRFHQDKGYPSLKAWFTLTGSSSVNVGNLDIRVGADRGAFGNG